MNVRTRVRIPSASMGQSVEVRHARRGTGLMLRRGLHGAKNWVLEPEEDGTPRGPWMKTMKAAFVLLPVWVLLSPFTGDPQPGAQRIGVFQSIVFAVLATLAGLAWFSARERRLGREEPWVDLAEKGTESSQPTDSAPQIAEPEGTPDPFEKPQVSEFLGGSGDGDREGNADETGQNTQIDPSVLRRPVHQATSGSSPVQAPDAPEPLSGVLHDPLQQATTQGANPEEADPGLSDSWDVSSEDSTQVLHGTTPDWLYPQVNTEMEALHEKPEQATGIQPDLGNSDITDSDNSLLRDEPTVPLREALHTTLREAVPATEFPQVSADIRPVQQQLQGVLQGDYAERGPYEVSEGPVAGDWWLVRPDVPAAEPEEGCGAAPGAAESTLEFGVEDAAEPDPGPAAEPARQWPLQRLPEAVLWFLAAQAPSAADDAEKEAARLQVVDWLREETDAGRVTQAEAARILGVNRSTISRWLNDDPWAG